MRRMKKLSVKHLVIIDFVLASIISIYWSSAGIEDAEVLFIFLSILVAGSPFAYLLAKFLPFWQATNAIENDDVSIANAKIAQELSYLDTVVFSKNGTLTENNPYISDIVPEIMTQNALLSLAASIEKEAKHKIGRAIYNAAVSRGLRLQRTSATNEVESLGMEGIVAGNTIRVGRLYWLKKEKVKISAELLTKNDQLAAQGKVPIFVASNKQAIGIIALGDDIPPGLMTAIRRLKKLDIYTMIVSGDSARTVNHIKKELHIDDAKGALTAEGKIRELQLLKVAGKTVGMIGDLKHDQSLLEFADIGIELIPKKFEPLRINVVEVAGLEEDEEEPEENPSIPPFTPELTLKGGLGALIPAVEAARRARKIMDQNIIIAYLSWILLIPAAMGFFVAFGGSFLSLELSITGVAISLMLIFFNSLRIH